MCAKRDCELMLKPDSRKEAPSLFFQKIFFSLSGDKCQTAAPGGPSTPPPVGSPRQLRTWATSRSRIVIEPAPFPRRQLSLR